MPGVLERLPARPRAAAAAADPCCAASRGEMPKKRRVEPVDVVDETRRRVRHLARRVPDRGRSRRRRPSGRPAPREIASTPSRSSCQNASGSSAPPGNRQPMPTIAIGSRGAQARRLDLRPQLAQLRQGAAHQRFVVCIERLMDGMPFARSRSNCASMICSCCQIRPDASVRLPRQARPRAGSCLTARIRPAAAGRIRMNGVKARTSENPAAVNARRHPSIDRSGAPGIRPSSSNSHQPGVRPKVSEVK